MSRSAAVIGGGISGILVAQRLRAAGVQVTVVEAAHVGAGSSSRTAAGIRQQFSTRDTVCAMRFAVGEYLALAERLSEAVVVQNGYLFLFDEAGQEQATGRVAMQRQAGLQEVELLGAQEVAARFPYVDADMVSGATFCPTDGFLLPHVVYNGVAEILRKDGVEILQNAPVTGAEVRGDRIVAVKTPKGDIAADVFLDCTNAWSRRTGALLGAADLPVDPLKRYLNFLKRDDEGMSAATLGTMPLVIVPTGAYCRPENADTLLVAKKHYTKPDYRFDYADQDEVETPYSYKDGVDAFPYNLWAEVAEFLPALGYFGGLTATTAGFYGTTPDHNPFLAYDPCRRNLIRLVGFSGHGAMMGPFTASAALAMVEAGRDVTEVQLPTGRVQMAPFAIGRPYVSEEALVI